MLEFVPRRRFGELLEPAQYIDGFPASRIVKRVQQPLIAHDIQLPVVTRTLEQRLDFGKTGIEMHFIEGRFAFRHQTVQTQFEDGLAHNIDRHPVHAVFQLFDIDHDLSLSYPEPPAHPRKPGMEWQHYE